MFFKTTLTLYVLRITKKLNQYDTVNFLKQYYLEFAFDLLTLIVEFTILSHTKQFLLYINVWNDILFEHF